MSYPVSGFLGFPCITMEGDRVHISPLTPAHIPALADKGKDDRIWSFFPKNLSNPEQHSRYLHDLLEKANLMECIPFVITDKYSREVLGFTRIFNLCFENKHCEIGSWLHPDSWATGINQESKRLMLAYCFEILLAIRVQFRTDTRNIRSGKALEKMGAKLEGVIRRERILANGYIRDAAIYSILKEEWEAMSQCACTQPYLTHTGQ